MQRPGGGKGCTTLPANRKTRLRRHETKRHDYRSATICSGLQRACPQQALYGNPHSGRQTCIFSALSRAGRSCLSRRRHIFKLRFRELVRGQPVPPRVRARRPRLGLNRQFPHRRPADHSPALLRPPPAHRCQVQSQKHLRSRQEQMPVLRKSLPHQ